MARLKDRGTVIRRDNSFAARLDVARPAEQPTSVAKPAPSPAVKKSTEMSVAASTPADKPCDQEAKQGSLTWITDATSHPSAATEVHTTAPKQKTPPEAGKVTNIKLRVTFRCPTDLTERATTWAEKARCPVSAVFRKAFADLRPQLIERIEAGINYTEVPNDRMKDASHPFDTSMMISRAAYDRLTREVDPEAMTGIEGPMSRWARAQFIPHFNAWLAAKGH
ncbi:hypothetical protein [Paracoccus lutimaris]|uniref:Uncharacterized protein n=1 Tax=Paracoccus lutimaris TaxID=1490030 RepID=A0A368YFI4_9RHOB|nr:hypothetical protein [Paracoccus lutimaris]RCW78915.1 hypothetical protein DFP89_13018 [Paracoccus lutimaris]